MQQYSVILLHCDHWRHFESFLLKAFFLPSFLIYLNWLPACVRGSVEIKKSFMLTLEQVSDLRLKEGRGQVLHFLVVVCDPHYFLIIILRYLWLFYCRP